MFKKISGKISKTVVFNLLMLALGVISLVQASPVVPREYLPWLVIGAGVVNEILRIWFTSEPIAAK